MGKTRAGMSMSLDGFIAGPNVRVDNGMGDDGDRLHDWMFAGKSESEAAEYEREKFASTGAVLMGRTMLDMGIGPWGDEPGFHAPVFVVTHRVHEPIARQGGTTYTFVTDGPDAALRMAREAAAGRDVYVAGGAAIARYYFAAGAIDELRLHIVPILLGNGTPLFNGLDRTAIEFDTDAEVDTQGVVHMRFRIRATERA
jgi:dihydrofolate reductase